MKTVLMGRKGGHNYEKNNSTLDVDHSHLYAYSLL